MQFHQVHLHLDCSNKLYFWCPWLLPRIQGQISVFNPSLLVMHQLIRVWELVSLEPVTIIECFLSSSFSSHRERLQYHLMHLFEPLHPCRVQMSLQLLCPCPWWTRKPRVFDFGVSVLQSSFLYQLDCLGYFFSQNFLNYYSRVAVRVLFWHEVVGIGFIAFHLSLHRDICHWWKLGKQMVVGLGWLKIRWMGEVGLRNKGETEDYFFLSGFAKLFFLSWNV